VPLAFNVPVATALVVTEVVNVPVVPLTAPFDTKLLTVTAPPKLPVLLEVTAPSAVNAPVLTVSYIALVKSTPPSGSATTLLKNFHVLSALSRTTPVC
jgi:hypothetical protein